MCWTIDLMKRTEMLHLLLIGLTCLSRICKLQIRQNRYKTKVYVQI